MSWVILNVLVLRQLERLLQLFFNDFCPLLQCRSGFLFFPTHGHQYAGAPPFWGAQLHSHKKANLITTHADKNGLIISLWYGWTTLSQGWAASFFAISALKVAQKVIFLPPKLKSETLPNSRNCTVSAFVFITDKNWRITGNVRFTSQLNVIMNTDKHRGVNTYKEIRVEEQEMGMMEADISRRYSSMSRKRLGETQV